MTTPLVPANKVANEVRERRKSPKIPPVPVYRFAVEQYRRLSEIGVLTEDDRVELLDGWIVPKGKHSPRHDGTIELLEEEIRSRLLAGWRTRAQSSVRAFITAN